MRTRAVVGAALFVLVALFSIFEREASAREPACVNVAPPFLSDGTPLAAGGATGAIGPGAARLRVAAIRDVVVGSKVFVGSGFVAHQEIATVKAVTPDPQAAGYVFYAVTLARAHAWDESVYRAWVGSICAPPCEDGKGAFPACMPRCPAWAPCRAPSASSAAITEPLPPFTPPATGYAPGPPSPHPAPLPTPTSPTPYAPGTPVYPPASPTPFAPGTSPPYNPGGPPTPPPPSLPAPGH